jgi:hypothetical protein
MATEEMIKDAKNLIGVQAQDDYILDPAKHAERYQTDQDIHSILDSSRIKAWMTLYSNNDKEAIKNQVAFRRWSSFTQWMIFLTAATSALLLATGALSSKEDFPKEAAEILVGIFTVFSILTAAAGSFGMSNIKTRKLLPSWMNKRAKAEFARSEYFREIIRIIFKDEQKNDPRILLLKLEYFRRYHLDVQFNFYNTKKVKLKIIEDRSVTWSLALVAFVFIFNGLAAYLGSKHTWLISISSLVLIFQALSALFISRENIFQNGRNAERYENASNDLLIKQGELDDIRKMAASGNYEAVEKFTTEVCETILNEHRQWLGSLAERENELVKLDQMLEDQKKEKEKSKQ